MKQHKAKTPMIILSLVLLSIPFNQFPNIVLMLIGVGMSYVNIAMHQISFAKNMRETSAKCFHVNHKSNTFYTHQFFDKQDYPL
jgi:hypothetical protein